MPKISPSPPLQWSQAMQDLYNKHVACPIIDDSRTDLQTNVLLGHPFGVIQNEVLKKGRADFTSGFFEYEEYGELSTDDKVLLYGFIFMKLHFFEALATFRAHKSRLLAMFSSPRPKLMVDLGCGPGTAGLALVEFLNRPKFLYLGVDRARPMLRKAKSMLEAAKADSLLATDSLISTTASWIKLREAVSKLTKPINVLVNATYLFASDTVDVNDLCNVVMDLKQKACVKQLLFTYSNTEDARAGVKFVEFKKALKGEFSSIGRVKATFTYRKKRGSNPESATYVRQLLIFKD